MTKVYLIRHAEAEGNLYRRIHGQYDSLITERGQKQLVELEKRFSNVRLDAVYSSDLNRTVQTAGAVLVNKQLDLIRTPLLREVNMGVWEDKTWGEVERFEPEQLEYFNNNPEKWNVAGCERFFALRKRLTDVITDIARRHDGETVAVVTHGSALRAFASGIMEVPPAEIKRVPHCDNTAVALLHFNDGIFSFDYYGDNSHLPQEYSTFAHQKWWRENSTYDSTNLRFVPMDLTADADRYLEYRRDAHEMLHGTSEELSGEILRRAEINASEHPRALSLALLGDMPAGIVELDIRRYQEEKAGSIDFFYMTCENRRTGIAVQLLGQAVSVYRPLGRERLRVEVHEKNGQTLAFCEKYGFYKCGEIGAADGRLFVLDKNIALPKASDR
jgi:probable phosphoglycerate mutase